jgi:hypothetical protein
MEGQVSERGKEEEKRQNNNNNLVLGCFGLDHFANFEDQVDIRLSARVLARVT